MSKMIIGFLLGVVTTLVVVHLVGDPPSETRSSDTGRSSPRGIQAEMQLSDPANQIDEIPDTRQKDSIRSTSVEAAPIDVPLESQARSTAKSPQEHGSVRQAERSTATGTRDQYPPEIAEMIEERVDKELQARYENDEREESWATYMEGQLTAYFAQKPSLAQFNFSLIDCRTSVCSVHAIGYGHDALTQWNLATADLVSQQWMEFNNMSLNRRNPEPDILAIVLILTKKPPG